MKNKGLMALVFVFAALMGTAVLVGNASKALAYDDYGYTDYGYSDYGSGGYSDYGYPDYGSSDYGYSNPCDYGCGSSYDYGYSNPCDYGCGSYNYGYSDPCDYGCGSSYDYGYDGYCDYDCGGYYSNPCDYGCGSSYDYGCDYGCGNNTYTPPTRNDCDYGYCGHASQPAQPVQPIINNTNNNNNNNNNANVNNNVNENNIRINIANPTREEPVRREVVRDREVIARADDQLICTPVSQSAGVNQTVNVNVSGGNGTYTWLTPGATNVNRRGSGLSLAYTSAGFKSITVTSGNQTASCSVQVTGGQVLAANIELPDTGMGGLNAQMGNLIAFAVSLVLGTFAVLFVTRRRRVLA